MSFGASKDTKAAMQQQQALAGQEAGYMGDYTKLALGQLQSLAPQFQALISGGPGLERLLSGQFNLMDQQQGAQQQALLANPNMQRGGAMNLAFSNLARGNMLNKGVLQSNAMQYGLQGGMQLGQIAAGAGGQMGSLANQGYASNVQNRLQADQMKWKNIMGLGTSLASLFVPGGMFGGLLGKLGGKMGGGGLMDPTGASLGNVPTITPNF